jgi:Putative addiction module component
MKTIPAEEVLAELDHIAEWGWEDSDPEWIAEVERRMDEMEAGTATVRSAEEVFAEMRARREARICEAKQNEPSG